MEKFKIVIASLPDRENCVAEIWHGDIQWCEISQEKVGQLMMQFYPHPYKKYFEFSLDEALAAIEKARRSLMEGWTVTGRIKHFFRKLLMFAGILFMAFFENNAFPASDSSAPAGHRVEPGGCKNISVAGTCTFTNVHPIDPKSGAPLPPDMQVEAGKTVLFEIGYAAPNGLDIPASIRVRAKPGDRRTLESFYSSHREAPCTGVIIRAPCSPGVQMNVQAPPPPVGTVETRSGPDF